MSISPKQIDSTDIPQGRVLGKGINGTEWVNNTDCVNVIIFNGESNSGGLVPNTSASAPELAPRKLQILNNSSLVFEPLDVGTNNLLGHTGLESYWYNSHGWEVGLANEYDNNVFSTETYLIKTGQGSSQISQWINTSDPYFTTFKERIDAAKAYFKSINKTPVFYVWYSQGINDSDNGTNVNVWAGSTKEHFDHIRAELGFCPIMITKLMTGYSAYNLAIDSIANEYPFVYTVDTSDLTLLDSRHWSYAGMKTIAQRMSNITVNLIGEKANYLLQQAYQLSLDSTPAQDIIVPTNVVWSLLGGDAVDSGLGIISAANTNAGGTYNVPINALNYFEVEATIDNFSATEGVIVCLDTDNTASYNWNSDTFLCGMFNFAAELYSIINSSTPSSNYAIRSTLAVGDKIRLKKSGNDIILSKYTAGVYIDVYTFAGILSGITSLYLKVYVTIGGTRAIKVTTYSEPNLPLQIPVFSTTERNALTSSSIGSLIYNSTDSILQIYDGSSWANV